MRPRGHCSVRQAEEAVSGTASRRTVGFYAPMPPARTGVADYAASLLAALRRHGSVELAPEHCDVALYHLGNNALHAEIYRRALDRPGVVVLHDAVLHHFFLGQLDHSSYIDEFTYNYGEWTRDLGRDLWRSRGASGADRRYFEYPMLKRIAERSRAVVVHNPAAARIVRAHAPAARIEEIPHLFDPPALPSGAEGLRFRQALGIGPERFLFGVFGYLRESKRLIPVMEAIRAVGPPAALLVAGEFVSRDLERAAAPLLAEAGVVRLPHLSESDFWLAACAVDACINLRYPAAGETSGIAIRLMGVGKPVLLTDAEECLRFPEDACIRIPPGPTEPESLRQHLVLLTSIPEAARAIGQRGAGHIQSRHRVDGISERFWRLLCDIGP